MIVMNVCADACSDETMELGSWGQFGTNYLFNESCKWRIQYNDNKVKISAICLIRLNSRPVLRIMKETHVAFTDCVTVGFLASDEWKKKKFVHVIVLCILRKWHAVDFRFRSVLRDT